VVVVVDVDEYMFGKDGRNLKQHVIDIFGKSNRPSQFSCRWAMFGSSGHEKQPESIRKSFTWRKKGTADETKSVVWVNDIINIDLHKSEVRGETISCPEGIQVNHYAIMSKEYFQKVKMTRGDAIQPSAKNVRTMEYFTAYDHHEEEDTTLKNLLETTDTTDFTCDIVIARYKENLDWFPKFSSKYRFHDAYLYNKFKPDDQKSARDLEFYLPNKDCIKENLPNVGRCDHTYLYHIVNKYDSLADVTIFTKGSYAGEVGIKLNYITEKVFKNHTSVFHVCKLTREIGHDYDRNFTLSSHFTHNAINRNDDTKSGFKLYPSPIRPFGKWYQKYFSDIHTNYISFKAVMAVSKKDIHQHPKSYYEMFLKQLEEHLNPEVAHYIERSWMAMFHPISDSSIFVSKGEIPCPNPQGGGSRKCYFTRRSVRRRQRGGFTEAFPVFIICYNQYTYVKSMVEQLQKYPNLKIYVIDNKSTFPPLVKYLKSIEDKVNVLYQEQNYGHKVYERDDIIALGGDKYIVTDPDLILNEKMPLNFVEIMSNLSDKYRTNKIGLALDIKNNIDLNKKFSIRDSPDRSEKTIAELENPFWIRRVNDPDYEMYHADIDTTFALINKKYYNKGSRSNSIRIAGDFTCIHRPWLKNYENELTEGEKDFYLNKNISTNYIK
jgi:hypothetical protein